MSRALYSLTSPEPWPKTPFIHSYISFRKTKFNNSNLSLLFQDATANSILIGEIRLMRHQDSSSSSSEICKLPVRYHTSVLCPPPKSPTDTPPVISGQSHNNSSAFFASNSSDIYDRTATLGLGIQGRHGRYLEAESVVYLGRSKQANMQILSQLEAGSWIDRQTKAVLIEFTMFHVATSLFR